MSLIIAADPAGTVVAAILIVVAIIILSAMVIHHGVTTRSGRPWKFARWYYWRKARPTPWTSAPGQLKDDVNAWRMRSPRREIR